MARCSRRLLGCRGIRAIGPLGPNGLSQAERQPDDDPPLPEPMSRSRMTGHVAILKMRNAYGVRRSRYRIDHLTNVRSPAG